MLKDDIHFTQPYKQYNKDSKIVYYV